MKTRFAVVALLASLFTTVAFAAATEFDWVESQVLTRAAPSAIDDGIAPFVTGSVPNRAMVVADAVGASVYAAVADTTLLFVIP